MPRYARPLGVTIVAVLIWVVGVLYVAGGMYVLTRLDDAEFVAAFGSDTFLIINAFVSWVLALLLFGGTAGLLRGNRLTRMLLTVMFVVAFGSATFVFVAGFQPVFGPISGVLAVVALVLLWSPHAREYFTEAGLREPALALR